MLKAITKLELGAEDADFTDKDGKKVYYTRYFVLVGNTKIPLTVTKSGGQVGKDILRDCFEKKV